MSTIWRSVRDSKKYKQGFNKYVIIKSTNKFTEKGMKTLGQRCEKLRSAWRSVQKVHHGFIEYTSFLSFVKWTEGLGKIYEEVQSGGQYTRLKEVKNTKYIKSL